jgi:hypothetical protein
MVDLLPDEALRSDVLKKRVAFVPESVWQALGLDRGDEVPAQETQTSEVNHGLAR